MKVNKLFLEKRRGGRRRRKYKVKLICKNCRSEDFKVFFYKERVEFCCSRCGRIITLYRGAWK